MIRMVFLLVVAFVMASCSALRPAKTVNQVHDPEHMIKSDNYYGYTPENPIKVGAFEQKGTAPQFNNNHHIFFSRLRDHNGHKVSYLRRGSCCAVFSRNFPLGDKAPLDVYEVTYKHLSKPLIMYINMYDYERPRAPNGFVFVD